MLKIIPIAFTLLLLLPGCAPLHKSVDSDRLTDSLSS